MILNKVSEIGQSKQQPQAYMNMDRQNENPNALQESLTSAESSIYNPGDISLSQ